MLTWACPTYSGVLYLYVKTIERAHTPMNMWEKIKLSNNYTKALEQIDQELIYWPSFLIHKCKQRVTKITQYLIKMRRMKLREQCVSPSIPFYAGCILINHRPTLVGIKKKLDRREAKREQKALSAAHIERSIQKELLERLKSKAYGDAPLNVNEEVWKAVLDAERAKEQGVDMEDEESEEDDEEDIEFVEEEEEEDLEDEEGVGTRQFVDDDSQYESEDMEDAQGRDQVSQPSPH